MKSFTVDHYIQRDILRSLSHVESLRFSTLKPAGLESNLFMYHLKQLLQQGLVIKEGQGYRLSTDGLRHVARVTRTNLDPRVLPSLISLLVIKNAYGEYAMHTRPAQPFLGYLTFPGGMLRFNEELEEHIDLQLQEKIGCHVPLTLRGTASLRLGHASTPLTHVYAQIFAGIVQGRPRIVAKDERFAPQWIDVATQREDMLPDVPLIIEAIETHPTHFFVDIVRTVIPRAQS